MSKSERMTPIKAILISTGLAIIALCLNAYLPMAVEFSVSRAPVLWSSLNSWLKPPYLLVVVNVIITIIVATSTYYHSGEDEEIVTEPIVIHRAEEVVKEADFNLTVTFPPPISVVEVERSEVVCEKEKEEEISAGVINGGDQVLSKIDESENLSPADEKKPLVSVRSDHRKPVKSSIKGGGCNKRKKVSLRVEVVKPKPTFENTWKTVMEELKSTPLTGRYRRPDTFGLKPPAVLRKSVTFRDITNYPSMAVTPKPVKMKVKEEMSPTDDELNRRVEAFIKKTKQERLESMRLDKRRLKRKV